MATQKITKVNYTLLGSESYCGRSSSI